MRDARLAPAAGSAEHCVHCTASSTSPRKKHGAIIASRSCLYRDERLGMGVVARKASVISAAAVSSSAQL